MEMRLNVMVKSLFCQFQWSWHLLFSCCCCITENFLGEDFIEQFQYNFDHKNKMFVIQKKEELCNSGKNGSNTYKKVAATETVDVPPGTEMLVSSKMKGSCSVKQCILIPEVKFVKTHNLLVASWQWKKYTSKSFKFRKFKCKDNERYCDCIT